MDITRACRDVNELKPVAKQACLLFLEECKKAGIDIFITETYRPQARQNYLYEQGRTRPGKKVTWTKSSNHTGRMAWDIATNHPDDLYHDATLNRAGSIALKLGIEWGGTWDAKNLDKPHFEVSSKWKAPVKEIVDGKLRRIFTGTFATEKSALEFKKLVEKAFNVSLHLRKEGNRYRLYTGTFTSKTGAESFKKKVESKFYVTLQMREE